MSARYGRISRTSLACCSSRCLASGLSRNSLYAFDHSAFASSLLIASPGYRFPKSSRSPVHFVGKRFAARVEVGEELLELLFLGFIHRPHFVGRAEVAYEQVELSVAIVIDDFNLRTNARRYFALVPPHEVVAMAVVLPEPLGVFAGNDNAQWPDANFTDVTVPEPAHALLRLFGALYRIERTTSCFLSPNNSSTRETRQKSTDFRKGTASTRTLHVGRPRRSTPRSVRT